MEHSATPLQGKRGHDQCEEGEMRQQKHTAHQSEALQLHWVLCKLDNGL